MNDTALPQRKTQPFNTAWPEINELLTLKAGQVVVVAGPASTGKSFFTHTIAARAALIFGRGAGIISAETDGRFVHQRLIAAECLIPIRALSGAGSTDHHLDLLKGASDHIAGARILTAGDESVEPARLRVLLKRMISEGWTPGVVVLDYYSALADGIHRDVSEEALAAVAAQLPAIAEEYGITLLLATHLQHPFVDENPKAENIPAGAWRIADTVLMLRNNGTAPRRRITVTVEKSEDGHTGKSCDLLFDGWYGRFASTALEGGPEL
ncbi:DnaB-like helicase C-terminal domain-containing protein [Kitasatospora sp. MBT66]|uniref:DnaB-like helicase C-terminal domain-containing protein n=1 Tax=Kitasatospora sp. MBT66 TaxID=1444769 RepID=UPI0005BCB6A3|nr:DnaB-like helicase C-terminal domain-containing protein [Kitasatospora sp. MBT66]